MSNNKSEKLMNVLIHGFNVHKPEQTVGKLRRYVKNTFMFNYGWRFLSVLWHNKRDAKKLKEYLDSKGFCFVYAHSNGCAIAVESARQGAKIHTLICINPALKCKTKFPKSIGRVIVIYTKHDNPTKAARFFDKVPFIQLIVPNAWGAMGAIGYTGDDERVLNWDLSKTLKGHSDFFDDSQLKENIPHLNELLSKPILK